MGEIVMTETVQFGPGELTAVVDTGVVQPVDIEGVTPADQSGDHPGVGHEARAEQQPCLLALEARHRFFQLMVNEEIAAHQAGGAGTGTPLGKGATAAFDEGRMRGEGQIIV